MVLKMSDVPPVARGSFKPTLYKLVSEMIHPGTLEHGEMTKIMLQPPSLSLHIMKQLSQNALYAWAYNLHTNLSSCQEHCCKDIWHPSYAPVLHHQPSNNFKKYDVKYVESKKCYTRGEQFLQKESKNNCTNIHVLTTWFACTQTLNSCTNSCLYTNICNYGDLVRYLFFKCLPQL